MSCPIRPNRWIQVFAGSRTAGYVERTAQPATSPSSKYFLVLPDVLEIRFIPLSERFESTSQIVGALDRIDAGAGP
jgi:hypothetical protein